MHQKKSLFVFIVIALSLFTNSQLYAQFSFSIHYTVNDGLPSSKIYDVLQDKQGYIWFATENGVSRFDGSFFKNYTISDGLHTNSTIRLYEDYKGRIWFMSYHGAVSYFEENRVITPKFNDLLLDQNILFVNNIYVGEDDTVWLSPFNGRLIRFDNQNKMEIFGKRISRPVYIKLNLEKKKYGYSLYFYPIANEEHAEVPDFSRLPKDIYQLKFSKLPAESQTGYAELGEDFLVYCGRRIYQVSNEGIVSRKKFNNEIINVSCDEDNIWISEKFNGVHRFKKSLKDNQPETHFLKGMSVSKVLKDNEGNYWFSTTENGVYFVPSLHYNIFTEENTGLTNSIILDLTITEDHIFLSTDNKELYQGSILSGKVAGIKKVDLGKRIVNNVYSLLYKPENELYNASGYDEASSDGIWTAKYGQYEIYSTNYGYEYKILYTGDIGLGYNRGIKILNKSNLKYNSDVDSFLVRTFSIEQTPDSLLWLGTIEGLYTYNGRDYKKMYAFDPVLSSRISSIRYHNGLLWVASFDNGLAVVSPNSVDYLSTSNGLSSNRIKTLFIENDSLIWVGTNKGINRLSYEFENSLMYDVYQIDIWDGLPSNEINKIEKHDGYLWLGTNKGLVSFLPKNLSYSKTPPSVHLQNIFVNGVDSITEDVLENLAYNQNSIEFFYNGIRYKDPESLTFWYKLSGLDDIWYETKNTSVRFPELKPGNYTFILQASDGEGSMSLPVSQSFYIKRHFTQTAFFKFLLIILGGGLILYLFYYIYRSQRNSAQLQRQIFLAEQKAVLSQMNPHFIFNSLNSIQNFIIDNDAKNANIYLVIFSSLIRKILEGSKKNFISLKEEIETIKLYLELEKFRFDQQFEYNINVDGRLNADHLAIPSMILQPYLENAIWHGLVPKKEKGSLEVDVEEIDPGMISISITDNGIGRDKAAEINKRRKHHKATGMKNVEERLNLLNRLNKTKMTVEIIDLYDKSSSPCGTRVEFHLDV